MSIPELKGGDDGSNRSEKTRDGDAIIAEFSEENWGTVDDLAAKSIVQDVEPLDCTKTVERTLTVEDSEENRELSRRRFSQINLKEDFMPYTARERDRFVPEGYEKGWGCFLHLDRVDLSNCTECDGRGERRCLKCGGDGYNKCSECSWGGKVKDSDGVKRQCLNCGGTNRVDCRSCEKGNVTCDTCEGEGGTYKLSYVQRVYEPKLEEEIEAQDINHRHLRDKDGTEVRTTELETGEDELKRESTLRRIPVTAVRYTYDGESYELFDVDGTVRADDYPKTQMRKALPYLLFGLLCLCAIVALFYFNAI